MTFLAAPDQKVALLVIPGWANAVPALPVLLVLWSPQEPKQSLLMYKRCYSIMQSVESGMQHVRVHSKALELIGDGQSLVHKVVL